MQAEDYTACYKIQINGIVQGVGFRPHVFRLASELGLKGWVLNSSYGLFVEVEGKRQLLDRFVSSVIFDPPPLALIKEYQIEEIIPPGYPDFTIRESKSDNNPIVMISPDIAICEDCKREVSDPNDRRYQYPFTNCTNCGPRFTIIKDLPYDRKMTTMSAFPMCPACREEYGNPLNRRFHAQPNACPVCGPHIYLLDRKGQKVQADIRHILKQGYILAVKGLGGFHLAVDAHNAQAVSNLRKRKKRDAKPFALMVKDLYTAHKYCAVNPEEEKLLNCRQAPIVIINCHKDNGLPGELIHPGLKTLGLMLPYTPLHFLLFDDDLDVLVMTSANISDEPLIIDNQEALEKLNEVADFFLVHNRDIYNPCDDSVLSISPLKTKHFFRRARGYVPGAIQLPFSSVPVLAAGSEMKNTFCITRGTEAYLSQHWGDLNHYNNYHNYLHGIERFKRMLAIEPEIIACDLHPDYQSTRWAKSRHGVKLVPVQHHHAHMAAAMAENGLEGESLGLICDGTGLGTDGAIWGCELLRGTYHDYKRLGHLQYQPLIGGDISAKRPYRMAFIYLLAALGKDKACITAQKYLPDLNQSELEFILHLYENPGLEIETSSCGRLFDAIGAITGICTINHYDGQAAIELEGWANKSNNTAYPYQLKVDNEMLMLDVRSMWEEILHDLNKGTPAPIISAKFHSGIINMFTAALVWCRDKTGINQVVLSGGVFHNQIMSSELSHKLTKNDFKVYLHQQVPPGDGGISLGQAIIAIAR